MFIPPGKIVYDNLATSYVLLDALVADLREGGFSGIVEVLLRDTDTFVVISSGNVAAVVEKSVRNEHPGELHRGNDAFTGITLESLSGRSRLERGRVSIYGYSPATAVAIAGRINAESLYVGLSTEFTDIEKMILKLAREPDREWFIEIKTEDIPSALIHMRGGACRVLNSAEVAPDEDFDARDLRGNNALGKLIYECNRAGTTFDVYFTRAAETPDGRAKGADVEAEPILDFRSADMMANGAGANSKPESEERIDSGSLASSDSSSIEDAWDIEPLDFTEVEPDPDEQFETSYNLRAAAANHPTFEMEAKTKPTDDEAVSPGPAWNLIEANAVESPVASERLFAPTDGEAITEVKRLMGEIARTIEEAAQTVDRPESFSMSLRAGQIKVADRYPFLDPFAGEIEYLTGEIVFVGQATVEEFVAGLTEALKLAVAAVIRSTAYPDRFRAYVTEDLKTLLARERPALERFGLAQVIGQLIAF